MFQASRTTKNGASPGSPEQYSQSGAKKPKCYISSKVTVKLEELRRSKNGPMAVRPASRQNTADAMGTRPDSKLNQQEHDDQRPYEIPIIVTQPLKPSTAANNESRRSINNLSGMGYGNQS